MRIALIHYRLARQGGLETRLFNYMNWFIQAGHEVTVIYARKKAGVALPEGVQAIQASPGLALKPFRRIVFSNKAGRILKAQQFDFSLSLGRTVGQDAVLAAANHRGFLKALGRKKRGLSDWSQDRMDRLSFEKSKLIFAASSMMKDELVQLYGIAPAKIHLLLPPIQTGHFSPQLKAQQAQLKAQYGMSPEKTSFCFISTSHYRKGFDILLKAFEHLPAEKYELFVAGDSFRSQLPHIHSLGFVQEPAALYAAADFCLHPARFEPFGQVVTESIQCGTPVLVSHLVGAQEIISPEVGQVIASLAWEDWRKAILALKASDFRIPADYIQQKRLSLEDHMGRMLEVAFPPLKSSIPPK